MWLHIEQNFDQEAWEGRVINWAVNPVTFVHKVDRPNALALHALPSHIPALLPVFLRQEVLAESPRERGHLQPVVAGQSSLHVSVIVTAAMAAIGRRPFNQLPSSLPCLALARSWRNIACYEAQGRAWWGKENCASHSEEGRCREESVFVGTVPCTRRVIRTKRRPELVGCSIPLEFTAHFPWRIVYGTKTFSVPFSLYVTVALAFTSKVCPSIAAYAARGGRDVLYVQQMCSGLSPSSPRPVPTAPPPRPFWSSSLPSPHPALLFSPSLSLPDITSHVCSFCWSSLPDAASLRIVTLSFWIILCPQGLEQSGRFLINIHWMGECKPVTK